ncbi:DUF2163 domain-containing protein [Alsobacter sp. KACC 23698]|uniref:DUF2163 domain-containing protein n=1 Tax=Alsobacter sp. KACC 23698 TaxID=3149229 RepID=A0AAU7JIN6_9HYPH
MRPLSPTLSARLAEGATTLARCWKLMRRDGVTQGFTDHDRDLSFGGVVYAASTGLEAADTESQLGFAVGGGDVAGALSSASLDEADLAAGRYDAAAVEVWLVDWSDPASRVLLDVYVIGEVRRTPGAFVAELRGLAQQLDTPRGRTFQPACSADLGDARCGVDLALPAWRATGAVEATDGASALASSALQAFPDAFFTGGRLTFTSGPNAGWGSEVKDHRATAGAGEVHLWRPSGDPIAAGHAFAITAGCDKRLATCAARFDNVANFRGFPHMPGNDFLLRVARNGDVAMDGGSLFR